MQFPFPCLPQAIVKPNNSFIPREKQPQKQRHRIQSICLHFGTSRIHSAQVFLHVHRLMINIFDMKQAGFPSSNLAGEGRAAPRAGQGHLLWCSSWHSPAVPLANSTGAQLQLCQCHTAKHSLTCLSEPKQGQDTLIHKGGQQQQLLRLVGSTATSEVLGNHF